MLTIPVTRPFTAAFALKVQTVMDVILHIGAHRTATTSFQTYMKHSARMLDARGVGYWGPPETRRDGILSGVLAHGGAGGEGAQLTTVAARIEQGCVGAERRGMHQLVVSDENMLGSVRRNLRMAELYPDAAERLKRFGDVFGARLRRVVLSIRALDTFWASALAFGVARGHRWPSQRTLADLTETPRSWRDVIEEAAAAFPRAEVTVLPHEPFCDRPEQRLAHMLAGDAPVPPAQARYWQNGAPDLAELRAALRARGEPTDGLPKGTGPWRPFDTRQAAALRERYEDDLFWLRGAGRSTATLIEEATPDQAGTNLPVGANMRGRNHDRQDGDRKDGTGEDGSMARTG
jgi:hypothetical protein